ncbi:hypothetical protein [Pontibacter kalidii]|uniref:hypothetical protein n=1 Tax=Pontibacter kalidii TaxID=2592049 RepID=UPI0022579E66|nr:hypothetical protein [Pontibacter kalidii]
MQPIFSRNIDFNKIAFVNWRIDKDADIRNILNLAEGYSDAAIELAKLCLSDNEDKKADILIFPILTNANHGIELYLKGLNWILNKLLESANKIEGGHNIQQIFQTLKSKIKLYKGRLSVREFEASMEELQSYITELFDKIEATPKDNKMDFSRYPFNNVYDNHFYVKSIGNIEIDLENFVFRFEKIKETLDTMSDYLYYQELNHEW